jgi:hypothetical protein
MQCKEVEEVLEQEGLAPLPEAARAHVAACPHCQGFIADLETIVSAAQELPTEVEPPAYVWVSLRNQLEREGLIREPEIAPASEHLSWWHGLGELLPSRTLATASVGLLIAALAILQLRQPVDNQPIPAPTPAVIAQTVESLKTQELDVRNMQLASTSPVDVALQQNLQQIDDFIADCERHLKQAPQDELTREYLYSAYEQKAELLSAMLDRARSVN